MPYDLNEIVIKGLIGLAKRVGRGESARKDPLFLLADDPGCPLILAELLRAFRSMTAILEGRALETATELKNLRSENENMALTREKLSEAVKKLQGASLETIYRLVLAAEYKDEDTSSHIQRMSHYSAAVARSIGLPENSVEEILHASPMHDVGKIGIPDWILLKPGKLDPGEWEIMKTHTTIGAGILEDSQSEIIRIAEVIAISHHEKWDGSGYPFGLKEEDIPLSGRIVAIADVFDALTSKRPYKEAFSEERAFTIISKETGRHFDPKVVEAFFGIREEILSIRLKFKDTDFMPPAFWRGNNKPELR